MSDEGYGDSVRQLYSQFLYRVKTFGGNINIGFFSPTLYITAKFFKEFRNLFLSKYIFEGGFIFKASHFSDVQENWGISFSILSNEK
jgi:hypothetical protein